VEDQPPIREGLEFLINHSPGFQCAAACASGEEALRVIPETHPDVVLMDIGLPGMSGTQGVHLFKERFPALQILMLTVHADDEHVFAAICAGACGYLLKDTPPEALLGAIRELHAGGAPMSPGVARSVVSTFQRFAPPVGAPHGLSARELDVLRLLVDGHSYKTAARALGLSIDTVRFHVRHVYEKLHVPSKSEAVRAALERRILP
jgi:DNA-binding NarL/FixJ family response regulator